MRWTFSCLLLLISAAAASADELRTLITQNCLDCHDNETRKADLSLESLNDSVTAENAAVWLRVLEQIDRRAMPPVEETQPSEEARHQAVLELEEKLAAQARTLPDPKTAVLRRLNRTEYRATIRDLLRLNVSVFDPTREFPDDNRLHGFASNGEKLVTSSFLLRQYLEAAEQCIARAVHFEPRPYSQHWDLLPPFDRTTGSYIDGERRYYRDVVKQPQPQQMLYERMRDLPKGGYHPIDDLRAGMQVGGWYTIRILAEAKFRYADLDPKKMNFPSLWDPQEPLRLSLSTATLEGIDPDNKEVVTFTATHLQAGQREVAIWDLPDDEPTWLECRVWLDRGHFLRLGFPNGPSNSNYRLQSYFLDNKRQLLNAEQLEIQAKDMAYFGHANVGMWFQSPRIHLYKIEVDGPQNEIWPPESHRAIFGDEPYRSERAADVLQGFATRAWRRPATAEQVARIVDLVRRNEKAGRSPEAAIQDGLTAILCTPDFLYREETGPVLSGYEVASRLSYFLWSTMPDDRLLWLADSGEICRPDVLRQEAERMLDDPRADAFIDEFLNGWLALRKLGTMAPDVHKFSIYYDEDLEPAMKTETRLFFRQLLYTGGTIDGFLDSDYTFLNPELARLYGIDPQLVFAAQGQPVEGLRPDDLAPDGEGDAPSMRFARVKLTDTRRGGLLGQASVLTLTANGVDTSPVIRGVWILENLLGAPPAPPPPNVPALEPDIRGAKTIREQLQKHRESETCASCHRQIDPPGFALESFDAIGRWRTHYALGSQSPPIDPSGRFGSSEFQDVRSFKAELLRHHEQCARCFVEKLLVFALGRELTVADRPSIRRIVETAAVDGYRIRDLLLLSVTSELFARK
ncbi:MAG TPA: DUF1592 domain-containing protein [Pirellulales bacterium]|jgi:hypothetical protein|nr:DUF1592 domain-containing protein [Pirellulales bacterium]